MTKTRPPIQQHSLYHMMTMHSSAEDDTVLAASAEQILRFRRHRDSVFQSSQLFSDPAWDILLEIFRATTRGIAIAVSDTSDCAGIASSSATRWIRILEAAGFVCRKPDTIDKRRVLLDMTPMGRAMMNQTLDRWLMEDKGVAPSVFFPEKRPTAKSTAVLSRLRGMADHSPLTDLPALIVRCLGEFQKEHHSSPAPGQAFNIASQVERMLSTGAHESAVLLLGRTFVPSWSPCVSGSLPSGTMPTSADLGRALLKDLLDTVLAEFADPLTG